MQGEWVDWQSMLVLQGFKCESEEVGRICPLRAPQKAPRWIHNRSTSLSDQSQQALMPSTWKSLHGCNFVMFMFTKWHPHHEATFYLNGASHDLLFEALIFLLPSSKSVSKFFLSSCAKIAALACPCCSSIALDVFVRQNFWQQSPTMMLSWIKFSQYMRCGMSYWSSRMVMPLPAAICWSSHCITMSVNVCAITTQAMCWLQLTHALQYLMLHTPRMWLFDILWHVYTEHKTPVST